MPTLADLPTPALLVDLDRLEANLRRMQERCDGLGVALRPHVKTHKCLEVGRMWRPWRRPGRSPTAASTT